MLVLGLLGSAGWLARPAVAQTCTRTPGCGFDLCKTPATPVPQSRWGELQPVDSGPFPDVRDLTSFDEYASRYDSNPFYYGIDIQQGFAFTAMDYGVKVWNVSAGGAPVFVSYLPWQSFLSWPQGQELKTPLQDISLPAGNATIGAIAGESGGVVPGVGTAIIDFSVPSMPKLLYQDPRGDSAAVYAAQVNGTNYAFAASSISPPAVHVYNMDLAKQLYGASPCNEINGCSGVHVGTIGTRFPNYIAGVDHFIVDSSGSTPGFDLWDVSSVTSPVLKVSGLGNVAVLGVAMWKSGNSYYLAARTGPSFNSPQGTPLALQILDVSCITGTCSSPPPVLSTYVDTSGAAGTQSYFLTLSYSGNTPFLYLGSDQYCGGVQTPQREWLLDVSNPSAPRDITPPSTQAGGYWGWYYQDNYTTGFNLVMPRRGKFWGQYFYRAAQTLFDVHKHVGAVAPTAAFTWNPLTVYAGTPVNFVDQSFGQPTSWTWTFAPDGSPPSSSQQSPANVSFPTTGQKSVTLLAANLTGSNPLTQTVNVLSPQPQVASVSVSPPAPLQCQPVTLTANGVTGQPPLSWAWAITTGGNPAPGGTSTSANSFLWDTKANAAPPASYTASVTVNNATNSPATGQVSFTLGSLPALPASSSFAPTNDSFTSGTVQFHVSVAGATEWSWNFGDGGGPTPFTNDPINGPNPTHTYTSIGTYNVQVQVRNCVNVGGTTSSNLQVSITQVTPLIASFAPQCFVAPCAFSANSPISFTDSSQGASFWDYDWNGTGTFSDSGHTAPVTTHTYTTAGTYNPALRVRRGTNEQATFTFNNLIISSNNLPATITVSGPSSGAPNQTYTFSATASNCTPSSTWSWSANGATISGSFTGPSITVSWATVGSYSVAASNAGCSGAFGSAGITISSGGGPGPGGGTLTANFVYAPLAPAAGQSVSFDGSASTGSPTGYIWNFGDGATGSGITTTHAFAQPGSYQVKLDVEAPGSGSGCLLGTCVNEKIQTVTVVKPTPPPLNPAFDSPSCVNQFGIVTCTATTGVAVTLTAQETNPAAAFAWDFGDGTQGAGSPVTHTWQQAQTYTVTLTVSAANFTTGTKTQAFQVSGPPPLNPDFTSANCPNVGGIVTCSASTGVAVTLTASETRPIASFAWDFGDGTQGTGSTVTHTWQLPQTYTVTLTVSAANFATATKTQVFQVSGPPPLNPDFTSPNCPNVGGIVTCSATAGQAVTLTASETRPIASFAWDFGDGTQGTGGTATHTWKTGQTFTVTLTVSAAGLPSASKSHAFQVQGPAYQSVVLPWVAETRGALVQSCDLYLHNPGSGPVDVTLQFLKRGTPEGSPPQSTATIQPGATMFAPDVLQNTFQRDNTSGFVTVTVKTTDPLPIITSFNTVTRTDGGQFGQTVPGLTLPGTGGKAQTASTFQDLVGLNDNGDQLAYFGITNPTSTAAIYHVRLFDDTGKLIGESSNDLTVSPFGQRQFQQEEVHSLFGLTSASDYRVEIENKTTGAIFPYGENVRLASGDPSFLAVGSTSAPTQYVIGAFSNAGTWQTDLVLANTSPQPMNLTLTFTRTGVQAQTTSPVSLTLAAGQTQRLTNAIAGQWNINNVVGVITVTSTAVSGPYPIVQAESYNNANPSNRFGQSMRAFADADAAAVGQTDYLVGLRQDANHLTTFWVFNSSTDYAVYDVVYRALDGTVLGTVSNVTLPPGKVRQFLPATHPLRAAGATNGFTVQVVVKNGKALAAAQVLTTSTGDPAYVQGVAH